MQDTNKNLREELRLLNDAPKRKSTKYFEEQLSSWYEEKNPKKRIFCLSSTMAALRTQHKHIISEHDKLVVELQKDMREFD